MTTARNAPISRDRGQPASWAVDPSKSPETAPCKPVQGVCVGPPPAIPGSTTALANEAPAGLVHLVGLSNELTGSLAADGWALVPYGEHGNSRGLQIFRQEHAEQMVGYFKNGWTQVKRAFRGMPILRGHPDHADTVRDELKRATTPAERTRLQGLINEIERRYPDKTVYGTIADLEARPEGLAIKTVLTEAGLALVNDEGLTEFSPHWLGIDVPERPGAKAPIYLVSIGLVKRGNITGTSLINSAPIPVAAVETETQKENTTMPTWLTELLGLPADATEDQIKSAIEALKTEDDGEAAAAKVEAAETALANERAQAQADRDKVTQLESDLAKARTALANERDAHATALVNEAILAGKITEAAKPTWIARLKANFKTEATALANEQAVKVDPRTARLGDRKGGVSAKEQFISLVNEKIQAEGLSRDDAWRAVKRTEQGKALFAEMNAPKADA